MKKNTKTPPSASKSKQAVKQVPVNTIKLLIAVFALVLYGSSIGFKFTLDDDLFYVKHNAVQKGLSGTVDIFTKGSLVDFDKTKGLQPYRPLTLLSFAIEKTLFHNNPAASHFINVLLYIIILLVLFECLMRVFPDVNMIVPAVMVFLFAAHPIHTEVVASVKSRDELLSALFALLSWQFALPRKGNNEVDGKSMVKSLLFFALSLFCKESAIAFLMIFPLSNMLFLKDKLFVAARKAIPYFGISVFFAALYIAIVGTKVDATTEGLMTLQNVLYNTHSFAEASATRMEILFYYLKLLFVPWPLSWDYSFNQIPIVGWSSPVAWLGVVLYAAMLTSAFIFFRKKPAYAFAGLAFFILSSPTNNLFIINGAVIGERFLFLPSLGFIIFLGMLIAELTKTDMRSAKLNNGFYSVTGGVLVVFSLLTIIRCGDWKDNLTLFSSGVITSPNSSRTHYSLASEYMTKARSATTAEEQRDYSQKAIEHFKRSLEILPSNAQTLYNLGINYSQMGDTASAIATYRECIKYNPSYITAINNLGVIYERRIRIDSALYYYKKAYELDTSAAIGKSNLSNLYYGMGILRAQAGDPDGALKNYFTSISYNPSQIMAMNNIAAILADRKQYDSALVVLKRSYDADQNNLMVIENIAAVSFLAKNYNQAIDFANRGLNINQQARKSLGVLADTYDAMGNAAEAQKYRVRMNQAQ